MNSGIEVFFTQVNRPWSNASPGSGYRVNVYTADGPQYIGVAAPDGWVSIDLPPGRYMVAGTTGGLYVNFDTNETLVNVGCGQRVCVTLIPRTLHFCIWWLRVAMQTLQQHPQLAPAVADHAAEAEKLLGQAEEAIPAEHRIAPFFEEASRQAFEVAAEFIETGQQPDWERPAG